MIPAPVTNKFYTEVANHSLVPPLCWPLATQLLNQFIYIFSKLMFHYTEAEDALHVGIIIGLHTGVLGVHRHNLMPQNLVLCVSFLK